MHRKSSIYANISGFFAIIFMGFPVYWMVTTSFKNRQDVLSTEPTILPRSFTIENYQNAFSREGFYTSLRNSLIVVLITVAISLFLATCSDIFCLLTPLRCLRVRVMQDIIATNKIRPAV